MKKLIGLTLLTAGLAFPQTAETRIFRALMSSANEVPPISGLEATGVATLQVHVVRDAEGRIQSASVDFRVNYTFPGAASFTGLHIHRGDSTVSGPVTINTGLAAADGEATETGRGTIERQAQVPTTAAQAAFDTLNGLFENPSNYYVNLHTTANPGGAIRGQLQAAETITLMGIMKPENEVPPVTIPVTAVGTVNAIVTRGPNGALTSGEVLFDVAYDLQGTPATFTGLHVHTGVAGMNGPVTLNSGLSGQVPSAENGRGRAIYRAEIAMTNANSVAALNGIFTNPAGYYINIHTTTAPGGIARAQLRRVDAMTFQVTAQPSNEVPPIAGLEASAPSAVTINTLRNEDGTVAAGHVVFDVNHRFPGETEFTGLHVHDGPAGENGPVRLDSGISSTSSVRSATGFGNIYQRVTMLDANSLATLNALVSNPSRHYLNLHTTVNRGGAVRAQLAPARAGRPVIGAVVNSVNDVALTTGAPGGLLSFYGSNFANVTTNLAGWEGGSLPKTLNGLSISIDGTDQRLPLLLVSPTQVTAQLPFEAAAGARMVTINVADGESSAPRALTVAATAPGIFTYDRGGIVVRNSDFSLIGPDNPARAGDVLVVYATGLGQTTPAQTTGAFAPANPLAHTGTVTATIGGQPASVIYSLASPGFVGLNQVALTVPSGLTAGMAQLVLTSGGRSSNSVGLAVQ